MATLTENSTDTPVVISGFDVGQSDIVVAQTGTVTDLTIDVNITAPDEGGGPDPTLVSFAINRVDLFQQVFLHAYDNLAIDGVNYDDDRDPSDGPGSLDVFNGDSVNGTWTLGVINYFSGNNCTINSWALNFTYNVVGGGPSGNPLVAGQPSAITIPSGITYGKGRNQKKNTRLVYNSQSGIAAGDIVNSPITCPLNGKITDLIVTAKNTGSSGTTTLSLNKFSNGVLSTLISQAIVVNNGNTYYHKKYTDRSFSSGVLKNDVLFFTVDTIAADLAGLTVQLIVAENL